MRIKNVYLEGYLGILEGTSRGSIAVDFEPAYAAVLRRVLIWGRNGAGKSTFLNSLSPFPTQGDGRSAIIVPGRAGRKTIAFDRNGTEVKCDIRWSSKGKTSCFMYVGGSDQPLELTAKGNLGEYLTAVEQELGVTPDYLKMGRVGSRVSSFLDLGPGPRKNFISAFLPEVEEWAVMHRNVAKRVAVMRAQLQGLQVEVDRIEARDELESAARRQDAELARLREEMRRIDTRLGTATGAIGEMEPSRLAILQRVGVEPVEGTFSPIDGALRAANAAALKADNEIQRLVAERPKLANFVDPAAARAKADDIRAIVARSQGELDALRSQRSETRARLDTAIGAENDAKAALQRASGSAGSLASLAEQAEKLGARVLSLAESVRGLRPVPDDVKYEDVKTASDALMGLFAEISDLRSAFPTPDALDLARACDMDSEVLRGKAAGALVVARDLQQRLDTARNRIATIEAQASFHNRFAGMHCNDAKCPFERHIKQFEGAHTELEEKLAEVASLEGRIAASQAEGRDLTSAAAAAKSVVAAHARIRRHRPVLEAAGAWPAVGPSKSFYDLVAAPSTEAAEALSVAPLLENVAARRDLAEAERTLSGVRERIAALEALRDARSQLEEAAARATAAVAAAREELGAADARCEQKQSGVTSQQQALSLLEMLLECHGQSEAAHARIDVLVGAQSELDLMRGRWEAAAAEQEAASREREAVSSAMSDAESALTASRHKLARRDEFEARLADMQGRLERAQAVAEACHPAKGAPVEFLRDFLDSTRDVVNDLLDVAMRGEFRIGFSLSDSEFRIPVAKGSGRVIPDVTEASEGQLALAKTVISLALVKQTVQAQGGYNVICFDEIDGMLDRERNRERFAEIVERLSAELGLEQLVMISHNDNFAAAPAGIVLFPGHAMPVADESFLSNKLVLADFS